MVSEQGQTIRLGTRGSLLARTQTEWVAVRLRNAHPGLNVETIVIQTTGDMRRDVPFIQVGTKGMFVKEIEQALLDGSVDVGVHSLKDMPGELPDGLELACVPERESPLDAFLTRDGTRFRDLPEGATVGTSSIRRRAQLSHARPDLQIAELRGNVDTRLRKLDEGEYDAIVLACAGLNRIGRGDRITEALSPDICVPAIGQGALALETRTGDDATLELLRPLHHIKTEIAIAAERGFQRALHGGCSVPAGAFADVREDTVVLTGVIAAPDGSRILRETHRMLRARAAELGAFVAEKLLDAGGRELLGNHHE